MPECFTHCVVAFDAMALSAQVVSSTQAFIAGANGLNVFGFYKAWNKTKNSVFTEFSNAMRQEKTGDFLIALVQRAATPEQQSYVLGFIAHYATCCIMNPYIEAMCKKGQPYAKADGKQRFASSIDSMLALQNFKTRIPPLNVSTPILVGDELAQVSSLLHESILSVYETDISIVEISDIFHDVRNVQKKLQKTKFSKIVMPLRHMRLYHWKSPGFFNSKLQPAPALKALPDTWQNPYTEKQCVATLNEVLQQAAKGSSICINACIQYWLGKTNEKELSKILGNKDYRTGVASVEMKETRAE